MITHALQRAFDIICIDTIGHLPKSVQGNMYAVTIQCELSKYIVIIPITCKDAKPVARAIFENFVLMYGPMKEICTDMGNEYKTKCSKIF